MDLISVLTIIGIAIANIGTTISLFLWSVNHTEKSSDRTEKQMAIYQAQTSEILRAIQEEMKDFHGRMCAIEERGR